MFQKVKKSFLKKVNCVNSAFLTGCVIRVDRSGLTGDSKTETGDTGEIGDTGETGDSGEYMILVKLLILKQKLAILVELALAFPMNQTKNQF